MGKKKYTGLDFLLGAVFLFFVACFLLSVPHFFHEPTYNIADNPRIPDDQFDSNLLRLNTVNKTIAYCDSIFSGSHSHDGRSYPAVVSDVIRKRFYHDLLSQN